jgi:hypothetical protein
VALVELLTDSFFELLEHAGELGTGRQFTTVQVGLDARHRPLVFRRQKVIEQDRRLLCRTTQLVFKFELQLMAWWRHGGSRRLGERQRDGLEDAVHLVV